MPISRHLALAVLALTLGSGHAADSWRSLPLIAGDKVDSNWIHIGYGGWVVEDGAIRTDPHPKGLGLLVYKKERLGNCQIRVVFKTKDARSNSGVYVRIADGILDQVGQPGAAFERTPSGSPTPDSDKQMQASADRDEGPWYAVNNGYEVQVAGGHTGSIYSLSAAPAKPPEAKPDQWRTLIITLAGERISAELDGQLTGSFDSAGPSPAPRKMWYEPKREPKRPQVGFIGLQTHDPGDTVWYKEISMRPLPADRAK